MLDFDVDDSVLEPVMLLANMSLRCNLLSNAHRMRDSAARWK
jgi:hypothetical protein